MSTSHCIMETVTGDWGGGRAEDKHDACVHLFSALSDGCDVGWQAGFDQVGYHRLGDGPLGHDADLIAQPCCAQGEPISHCGVRLNNPLARKLLQHT